MKKIFVIAVILLFIGLGVQPAIADKEQNKETGINDNEDCELCPTIRKLMDVEIEKEYEKKSVNKNRFSELNNILKMSKLNQPSNDICTELFFDLLKELVKDWILILLPFSIILSFFFPSLNDLFKERYDITDEIFFTAVELDCDWAVPFKTILGEELII